MSSSNSWLNHHKNDRQLDCQESRGRASWHRRQQRQILDPRVAARSTWWQQGWIPESVWKQCWKKGADGWQWIGVPSGPETSVGSQRWRANKELDSRLSLQVRDLEESRKDLQRLRLEVAKLTEEFLAVLNASLFSSSCSSVLQFVTFQPYCYWNSGAEEEVAQPENQMPEKPNVKDAASSSREKLSTWHGHGPLATSRPPAGPLKIPSESVPFSTKKTEAKTTTAPSQRPSSRWIDLTSDSD